jgi:hypothetical protein
MNDFKHGELVETTENYITKPKVGLKPGKKRFGIIIEPKTELDEGAHRGYRFEDTLALVQWADNSEEKVYHCEIDRVVK